MEIAAEMMMIRMGKVRGRELERENHGLERMIGESD